MLVHINALRALGQFVPMDLPVALAPEKPNGVRLGVQARLAPVLLIDKPLGHLHHYRNVTEAWSFWVDGDQANDRPDGMVEPNPGHARELTFRNQSRKPVFRLSGWSSSQAGSPSNKARQRSA